MNTLLCFGLGYSAEMLADALFAQGWAVIGTTRDAARKAHLKNKGFEIYSLDELPPDIFLRVTHILHSIAPTDAGDEVLARYTNDILAAPNLQWLAYLSTTGVYGDHDGAWVDETTVLKPVSKRQQRRVDTENTFLALHKTHRLPVHIFRLAGIYGKGRSVVDDVRAGQARRIYKEGQVFSRIHVEDIMQTLIASIEHPVAGEIYNVCDDEPAPAHEVVAYACEQMGIEPPPLIAYEQAELSQMGHEFYSSNRRVSNRKIRESLKVVLKYPTYKEGVLALLDGTKSANTAD